MGEAPPPGPLPPNVAAYAEAVADWQAQPEPEQARRALVALRAGNLPPASLHRALAERRTRHGPLALTAALVLVDHEAESRSHRSRLRFLDSVLETISDHARRTRLAPPEPTAAAPGGGDGRRRNAPPRARGGTSGGTSHDEHLASALSSLAIVRARRGETGG